VRTEEQFIKDLDFLLKYYRPVGLHEIIDIVKKRKLVNKNVFHLTFDDGLKEVFEIISPILKKKGIPATFFLNTAFIDNKDLFYRYKASILVESLNESNIKLKKFSKMNELSPTKKTNTAGLKKIILGLNYLERNNLDIFAEYLNIDFKKYLKNQQPYLTSEQIKNLLIDGFTIGAHSVDHPEYSLISLKEQLSQTLKSINELQKKFPVDYKAFAFPFTDFKISLKFFNTVFNKSEPKLDVSFGTAGIKNDSCINNLQRIPIENYKFSTEKYIKSEYLYYSLKSIFNKNTIKRK